VEHWPNEQLTLDLLRECALAIGCKLDQIQHEQLNGYVNELVKWNKKSNLTGLVSEKDVIGNLVADSLSAISLLESNEPRSIIDVGTGGGIPGIPLKIAVPSTKLTLVEPNQKKVAFLHNIVGTLALKNTKIEAKRIEQMKKDDQYHGVFDFVLIKALRLDGVLPYVGGILKKNGKVICWRAKNLSPGHELFGFRILNEISYQLPFGFGHRILSIIGR